MKKWIFGIVGLAALLIVVVACNSTTKPIGSGGVASSSTGYTVPSSVAVVPTVAVPSMTANQASAVRMAQTYVDGQAFSRAGLVKQLTSKYGSGFNQADAEFAVAHITVDWKAEALEAAKTYMQMQGFSRSGLIKQLTSSYGSGFTKAEAEYAADQLGLK